jgi:hypothetical protein
MTSCSHILTTNVDFGVVRSFLYEARTGDLGRRRFSIMQPNMALFRVSSERCSGNQSCGARLRIALARLADKLQTGRRDLYIRHCSSSTHLQSTCVK